MNITTKVKATHSVKIPIKLPGEIIIEVHRADGSLKSSHTQPMHSWTHWFAQWLTAHLQGTNGLTFKDTGGTTRTIDTDAASTSPGNYSISIGDGVASLTQGVLIGTGTTAHDFDADTAIETAISDANMTHGANTVGRSSGATSFVLTVARAFTNVSGGTINVTESVLYPESIYENITTMVFMAARDVFTAVPVLNTEVITVTYTITFSSPLTPWFGQLLYDFFHLTPTANGITDTGGTTRTSVITIFSGMKHFQVSTSPGAEMILGTSSTAHDFDADRAIGTAIVNGTSSGQLSYIAGNISVSAGTTSDQIQLLIPVLNASGGSITVNEVAVYCAFREDTPSHKLFMLCRAVKSGGHLAIADGEAALFQVTLEIS